MRGPLAWVQVHGIVTDALMYASPPAPKPAGPVMVLGLERHEDPHTGEYLYREPAGPEVGGAGHRTNCAFYRVGPCGRK